jgi:hypothetical protein
MLKTLGWKRKYSLIEKIALREEKLNHKTGFASRISIAGWNIGAPHNFTWDPFILKEL